MKKAAALEKELRLRKEAKELAEATGISEVEGLKIARQRETLKLRAETFKGSGETTGEDNKRGETRIRLYNAQESLQRRLGRQSHTGARSNMNSMDRRSTDLGERFVREAESSRSGPVPAVMKGNDEVPGILKEIVDLEKRMVKIFENVVRV